MVHGCSSGLSCVSIIVVLILVLIFFESGLRTLSHTLAVKPLLYLCLIINNIYPSADSKKEIIYDGLFVTTNSSCPLALLQTTQD